MLNTCGSGRFRTEISELGRFLLYRLFILILCLALAFGTSLDSEESDSQVPNFPLLSLLTHKHETTIVVAPDGMMHLVSSSGKILWSFTSGPSIYSSFHDLPDNRGGDHNLSTEGQNFYIDFGYLDGDNLTKVELQQSVDGILRHTPHIFDSGVML